MTEVLNPGEYLAEITNATGNLAFANLHRADGSLLMAPDGVCVATAALHRNTRGGSEPRVGARYAVTLSPVRQDSTFTYFANQARMLSCPAASDLPLASAHEEEAM